MWHHLWQQDVPTYWRLSGKKEDFDGGGVEYDPDCPSWKTHRVAFWINAHVSGGSDGGTHGYDLKHQPSLTSIKSCQRCYLTNLEKCHIMDQFIMFKMDL